MGDWVTVEVGDMWVRNTKWYRQTVIVLSELYNVRPWFGHDIYNITVYTDGRISSGCGVFRDEWFEQFEKVTE